MKTDTTFLLVEDDEVDVMAMKRAFTRQKLANGLWVATDGLEALDIQKSRVCFHQDSILRFEQGQASSKQAPVS